MGLVSKKRGSLGFAIFRSRKAFADEFYFISFQLLMVLLVVWALFAYTNSVATDLGFEKRFTAIDMALLADVINYAPGTLKQVYTPISGGDQMLIKRAITAEFFNGTVSIFDEEERDTLGPTMFWYRYDKNMDEFDETVSLRGEPKPLPEEEQTEDSFESEYLMGERREDPEAPGVEYVSPNITFYKSGRKISFDDDETNALHLVCPHLNTSVDDWFSKKVFVAKMLASPADYANQSLPVNRVAQILSARYSNFEVSGSEGSGTSRTQRVSADASQISAIPDDAEIVIAIGDSGRQREPGALVTFVPADDDLVRSRKLACLVTNSLLTSDTDVYYTQIMPVHTDKLEDDSPLKIFDERSSDDQTIIFIDISNFGEDQMDVNNVAMGIYAGLQRFYGDDVLERITGHTFNFTITGDVLAALQAFGVSVSGATLEGAMAQASAGASAQSIEGSGDSPARRMFSVCTPRAEALDVGPGLQRLKDVTKYWQEQSLNDGAIYVRGGRTNRAALTCSNHGQASWILGKFENWFPSFTPPASCTPSSRNSDCTSTMRQEYQQRVVNNLAGHYICGDCGTYLVQLYACAFGRTNMGLEEPNYNHPISAPVVAAPPGTEAAYGSRGQMNVRGTRYGQTIGDADGTCWDIIQADLDGGLQFGDIIQMPGHYVMYVGGAGLENEILEMGGWSFPWSSGFTRSTSRVSYNGNMLRGIRLVRDAQTALSAPSLVDKGCVVRRMGSPTISENVEII